MNECQLTTPRELGPDNLDSLANQGVTTISLSPALADYFLTGAALGICAIRGIQLETREGYNARNVRTLTRKEDDNKSKFLEKIRSNRPFHNTMLWIAGTFISRSISSISENMQEFGIDQPPVIHDIRPALPLYAATRCWLQGATRREVAEEIWNQSEIDSKVQELREEILAKAAESHIDVTDWCDSHMEYLIKAVLAQNDRIISTEMAFMSDLLRSDGNQAAKAASTWQHRIHRALIDAMGHRLVEYTLTINGEEIKIPQGIANLNTESVEDTILYWWLAQTENEGKCRELGLQDGGIRILRTKYTSDKILTDSETARILGISHERVRQALGKSKVQGAGLKPYKIKNLLARHNIQLRIGKIDELSKRLQPQPTTIPELIGVHSKSA